MKCQWIRNRDCAYLDTTSDKSGEKVDVIRLSKEFPIVHFLNIREICEFCLKALDIEIKTQGKR
jgi:hypothetical protein